MFDVLSWRATPPLLHPPHDYLSIKDPSIVHSKDHHHVFATVRGTLKRGQRSHQIEHLVLKNLGGALAFRRFVSFEGRALSMACAPQIFFFRPLKKWALLFQGHDLERGLEYGPQISFCETLETSSWSSPTPLYPTRPARLGALWLDFWLISDASRMHLFFTSCDGKLWRASTQLDAFPNGFGPPSLDLEGDIFEASHTYALTGGQGYLKIIEAKGSLRRRYYKAFLSRALLGPWREINGPFASLQNVRFGERWTGSISHGELLRASNDERMLLRPERLRMLFQGVRDRDRAFRSYGAIPWRLGLLEQG